MAATRAATLRVTPFLRQGLQQTRPGPAGVWIALAGADWRPIGFRAVSSPWVSCDRASLASRHMVRAEVQVHPSVPPAKQSPAARSQLGAGSPRQRGGPSARAGGTDPARSPMTSCEPV